MEIYLIQIFYLLIIELKKKKKKVMHIRIQLTSQPIMGGQLVILRPIINTIFFIIYILPHSLII